MTDYSPPLPVPIDVRCRCGRKLARAIIVAGCLLEIRCPKCGRLHIVDARVRAVVLPVRAPVAVVSGPD